jgi:hypothetical protein
VPKVFSICFAVPVASTSMPLGSVLVTPKPWARSQPRTALTLALAGAYLASKALLDSQSPYCAEPGSEMALSCDAAPAWSRMPSTMPKLIRCAEGVAPSLCAECSHRGVLPGSVCLPVAAWAATGPATAASPAIVPQATMPTSSLFRIKPDGPIDNLGFQSGG